MKTFPPALFLCLLLTYLQSNAQLKWHQVDSLYQPLPAGMHVYRTTDSLDGSPNIAYYLEADLSDKALSFAALEKMDKRYTPTQIFEQEQHPLVVVNGSFFRILLTAALML